MKDLEYEHAELETMHQGVCQMIDEARLFCFEREYFINYHDLT